MTKGVLDGIKVISMGSAWAGPYVGRALGEMGAEVFRVAFFGATRPVGGTTEVVEAWKKKLLARGMSPTIIERAVIPDPGNEETTAKDHSLNVSGVQPS